MKDKLINSLFDANSPTYSIITQQLLKQNKIYLLSIFMGVLFLLTSCAPQTKESYLEDYNEFIVNVENESGDYTDEYWKKIEEEYNKFNGEWYKKFEDEFTWKDEILIAKYQFKFNLVKFKDDSESIGDLFSKEDYNELTEQLKYYTENQMKSDIAFIMEQAAEIGADYAEVVDSLLTAIDKSYTK